jgi:hypothetical protein
VCMSTMGASTGTPDQALYAFTTCTHGASNDSRER